MVLFITLYEVVLNFESVGVDEILKCRHSNESYRAVLSRGNRFSISGVFLSVQTVLSTGRIKTIYIR